MINTTYIDCIIFFVKFMILYNKQAGYQPYKGRIKLMEKTECISGSNVVKNSLPKQTINLPPR